MEEVQRPQRRVELTVKVSTDSFEAVAWVLRSVGKEACPVHLVQHYKGGIYTVIGTASHTETGESLVIYANAAGDLQARPSESFHGIVENGTKPRFVSYREGSK